MMRLLPLVLVVAACSNKAAEDCCECLVNKTPDGADTTDANENCLADDDADGSYDDETEKCPKTIGFAVSVIGGDDATEIGIKADGCREVCFDACKAVDPQVGFESPVVTAGTFTANLGGTNEEATMVVVSMGPHDANFLVNVNATTANGDWTLLLGNMPKGAGTYAFAPFTDFGLTTSTAGDTTGQYTVTTFDDRHIEASFAGTISGGFNGPASPINFTGAFTADFTVNDGEVSGLLGLQ